MSIQLLKYHLVKYRDEILHHANLGNPSLANVRVDGWSGLFAPLGTSISVINFINQEINKIIVDPEFKKRAFSQNLEVYAPSSPDQFSTFIKADSDLWLSVIKPLNIVENQIFLLNMIYPKVVLVFLGGSERNQQGSRMSKQIFCLF